MPEANCPASRSSSVAEVQGQKYRSKRILILRVRAGVLGEFVLRIMRRTWGGRSGKRVG